MNQELLAQFNLSPFADSMTRFQKPAIGFSLTQSFGEFTTGSKLGGLPRLPGNFVWPRSKNGFWIFLLQVDLAELARFAPSRLLPSSGLLTFY